VAGCAGFGIYGDRVDSIRTNGIHTTATVTTAALYRRGLGGNGLHEHIDVSYPYPGGIERNVRIWIAEQDRFTVGELVPIAYDPEHPAHAVLANRKPDLGPVGVPFFVAIVAGVMFAVYAIQGFRFVRAGRRALREPSRQFQVHSEIIPRKRRNVTVFVLTSAAGEAMVFAPVTKRGWPPLGARDGGLAVDVFGGPDVGAVVVVDPAGTAVTAGRVPRPKRV
jgi:hypothetical protein